MTICHHSVRIFSVCRFFRKILTMWGVTTMSKNPTFIFNKFWQYREDYLEISILLAISISQYNILYKFENSSVEYYKLLKTFWLIYDTWAVFVKKICHVSTENRRKLRYINETLRDRAENHSIFALKSTTQLVS